MSFRHQIRQVLSFGKIDHKFIKGSRIKISLGRNGMPRVLVFLFSSAAKKMPILIAHLNNNGSEKGSPNPFVSLPFVTSIGLTVTSANKPVRLLLKISTDRIGFTYYGHACSPILPIHQWSLILTIHIDTASGLFWIRVTMRVHGQK